MTRTRRRLAALAVLLVTAGTAAACRDDDRSPAPGTAAGVVLPGGGGVGGGGETVCRPAAASRLDQWSYQARLTPAAGLELQNLRFGPRLVAGSISVPYVRVTVGGGAPRTAQLTRTPQAGAEIGSTLVGSVSCRPEDAGENATGLSAVYRLTVPVPGADPVTVLVQQSYRFDASLDTRCEPTLTAVCRRFWPTTTWAVPGAGPPPDLSVGVVQRFAFDPDHASEAGSAGAGDLVRDVVRPNAQDIVAIDDLGREGRIATSGTAKVIDGGVVGRAWESWHQTGRPGVGMPSLIPGALPDLHVGHTTGTAGCSECVHAHWSWFGDARATDEAMPDGSILQPKIPALTVDAANLFSCRGRRCWTDGKPQILDGSKQTACAAWTSAPVTGAVDWCAGRAAEPLTGPPVLYWDATSPASAELRTGVSIGGADYAYGDSYWPVLRENDAKRGLDHSHGGNGSMFVVPARRFDIVADPRSKNQALVSASDGSTTDAGVAVRVRIVPGDPADQGPYYLRVRTVPGLTLNNPDPLWSPTTGGAPWVTAVGPDGRTALRNNPAAGELTAVLLLNRRPKRGELSFELDAAPDGTKDYEVATGDWADPLLDAAAWDRVDWRQPVWDALGCASSGVAEDFFKPENTELGRPLYADLTGDGRTEAIISGSCPAITASWPAQVFVFDGDHPSVPLRRLLTSGTDVYSRGVRIATKDRTLTITHSTLSPSAPRCCPDGLLTETYTWTGRVFELISRTEGPFR